MDIEDIKDPESLEAWLRETDQSQHACTLLAHRAAMRVAPFYWIDSRPARQNAELATLPICRALLISGVAGRAPTAEIMLAAIPVLAATASDCRAAATIATPSTSFVEAAAIAANGAATTATAIAAENAAAAATATTRFATAFGATWREIQADCQALFSGGIPASSALWLEASAPAEVGQAWERVLSGWTVAGDGWRFWIDWYEAALAGRPLDIDMLTEIALIDPEVWEGDEDVLNARIVEIYGRTPPVEPLPPVTESAAWKAGIAAVPVTTVARAIKANRPVLEPTLEAITGLIALEIERLQTRNYTSDQDMEECKRLISIFGAIHAATHQMAAHLVTGRDVGEAEAESVKPLLEVYAEASRCWMRENASDLVDSSFRLGLTAVTAAPLVYLGVPAHVAYLATGLTFGGKKLASGAKDIANNLKPGES